MEKFYDINNKILKKYNNQERNIISASIGFTNTIVSTFFVNDIIMYLAGYENVSSKNKIISINFKKNIIKTILDLE